MSVLVIHFNWPNPQSGGFEEMILTLLKRVDPGALMPVEFPS